MGPRKPVVYVVDDERIIAETLAMILNQAGFIAFAFESPRQALDAAGQDAKPDLLITDVMMPEMTGTDLAIQFRRTYPECKVLLFSGQAATANLLEAARAQGYEFDLLTKPIHPSDLLAKVRAFASQPADAQANSNGPASK
jgi:DNA-binding NtrC family response regulator